MFYTISFNANGMPFMHSAYDSHETAPNPLPSGELEVTVEQFLDWQNCQLQNGVIALIQPSATQLLSTAQAAQTAAIMAAYQTAISEPVSFTTAGGATKTFQTDPESQTILMAATQGYTLAGAVPSGFYWVSADNTQVPFTLADLSGLYAATLAQGWSAFQKKQTLKAQIAAATTVATVQGITW
jgi:hypothetical protein